MGSPFGIGGFGVNEYANIAVLDDEDQAAIAPDCSRLKVGRRQVTDNQRPEGARLPIDWYQPWLNRMRAATAAGKVIQRVRVMGDPPTPYQRFELAVTPHNLAVGEQIRVLDDSAAGRLQLPLREFWLFDGMIAIVMSFDDAGRFQYADVTEHQAAVDACRVAWETAWQHAEPYDSYAAAHPEYVSMQGIE